MNMKSKDKVIEPASADYTSVYGAMLEERLVALLKEKDYTVATAESCTGGLVAGRIVNVAGASWVFNEGYITYSNEAKSRLLGVPAPLITEKGAVSEETAREMAIGVAHVANAEVGVATTGIAGPDGGTKEKPVGTVFIACSVNNKVTVRECHFDGNREQVRNSAVEYALELACECVSACVV